MVKVPSRVRGNLPAIWRRTLTRYQRRNQRAAKRYANDAGHVLNEAIRLGHDTNALWDFIAAKVMKIAKDYGTKKWLVNLRLDVGDFSEAMWDGVFKLLTKYGDSLDSALMAAVPQEAFWRNFFTALHRRAKNVIRKAKKIQKYAPWHNAESYNDLFIERFDHEEHYADPGVNVERQALLNVAVTEAQNHPVLNALERNLLQVIVTQPRATLSAWADAVGLTHPEDVRRKRRKMAQKLKPVMLADKDDSWETWVA